jgi:hypothetical protein
LTSRLRDDKTKFYLSYDKLSDDKMPQDFKDSDFEVNTQKRTITWLSHQTNSAVSRIAIQPRINSFQSINQELPLITLGLKPFPQANTKSTIHNQ